MGYGYMWTLPEILDFNKAMTPLPPPPATGVHTNWRTLVVWLAGGFVSERAGELGTEGGQAKELRRASSEHRSLSWVRTMGV